MGKPLIVVGDKTSHGGVVLEASGQSMTGNVRIARVGDKVSCPKKGHGPCTIVSGDATLIIDGKPAARHGDTTSCGAVLIASQSPTSS
jgi:uncharacterized Zn-binding protein involved in type VI secretion